MNSEVMTDIDEGKSLLNPTTQRNDGLPVHQVLNPWAADEQIRPANNVG